MYCLKLAGLIKFQYEGGTLQKKFTQDVDFKYFLFYRKTTFNQSKKFKNETYRIKAEGIQYVHKLSSRLPLNL